MFTQKQYDRLAVLKARYVDEGMEPEDAAEEAADALGFDYDEVLEFENSMA